jgi:hypothetical protein
MFDVLLCYGFAANVIRAGYLGLVTDLFRQAWATCRELGVAAGRRLSRGRAPILRGAGQIVSRRLARPEAYVASMT